MNRSVKMVLTITVIVLGLVILVPVVKFLIFFIPNTVKWETPQIEVVSATNIKSPSDIETIYGLRISTEVSSCVPKGDITTTTMGNSVEVVLNGVRSQTYGLNCLDETHTPVPVTSFVDLPDPRDKEIIVSVHNRKSTTTFKVRSSEQMAEIFDIQSDDSFTFVKTSFLPKSIVHVKFIFEKPLGETDRTKILGLSEFENRLSSQLDPDTRSGFGTLLLRGKSYGRGAFLTYEDSQFGNERKYPDDLNILQDSYISVSIDDIAALANGVRMPGNKVKSIIIFTYGLDGKFSKHSK